MQKQPSPIPLRAHATPDVAYTHQRYFSDAQENHTTPSTIRKLQVPSFLHGHLWQIVAGMVVMVMLWVVGTLVVIPAITGTINHWNCGQAEICAYPINVGHSGISEFVTQYYKGYAIVTEFAGGDVNKAHVYTTQIEYTSNTRQRIITLSAQFINPNPIQGKPDLVVTIEGLSISLVLYNTGDSFQWERPNQ